MSLKTEVNGILRQLENPDGDRIFVLFKDMPWYNPETKLYEMRTYIEKHIDSLSKPITFARQEHFSQYKDEYNAYLEKKQQRENGTILANMRELNAAQLENCEICGIFTVEQLAEADAERLEFLGDEGLAKKAQAFLSRETEKDAEIKRLKAELEKVNVNTNSSPKRRGRKPAVREANKLSEQQQQRG